MLQVLVAGVGPIGASCARAIQSASGVQLEGMVDLDPAKQGKLATELTGQSDAPAPADEPGPRVTGDLDEALSADVDVAVVTTTSSFADMAPLLRRLIGRGVSVVSSCEEMAWPWYRHAELSNEIDAEAKSMGCAVLGTGVNPGFLMDALAVTLSSMVRRVSRVRCVRRVDAALRREPLQKKVGATMSVEQFRELAKQGRIGHKGLSESVALLGAGLSCEVEPDSVHETLDPVIAEQATESALGVIQPGEVAGMHNVGTWEGWGLRIELDLIMSVGFPEPNDQILIDGPVQLKLVIPGSLPGDSATVAALLNQIPKVHRAVPGLRSMLDMPPAGCDQR